MGWFLSLSIKKPSAFKKQMVHLNQAPITKQYFN